MRRALKWVIALSVTGAVGGALAWLVRGPDLPDGPVPIVFDKEVCGHCRMHIGEPAFAAQLQTRDRKVVNFDDPGCLFLYERQNRPDVHARWFRHHKIDRWLRDVDAAFVPAHPTPMGYGLGAVDAGSGGLTYAEAEAKVGALPRGHAR